MPSIVYCCLDTAARNICASLSSGVRNGRGSSTSCFWQTYRRFSEDDGTCDIDIAFVDRTRHVIGKIDAVASVDALCLNRNLPERLPFGGGHPYLQLAAGNEAIVCCGSASSRQRLLCVSMIMTAAIGG